MLFTETPYENVLADETGRMWPLGAAEVTQLRNNGQVIARPQSGGGGSPPGLDPRGRSVQARPGAAGGGVLGPAPAPLPMSQPTPSANLPPRDVPPGLDPRGRSVQAVPSAASAYQETSAPSQPIQSSRDPQLQRVMPRQRPGQEGAPNLGAQTPAFVMRGGSPGGWVDTNRQTSGFTPEQQDELRNGALESHRLRQDAANMQYESTYRQAEADKFRAEADKARSYNSMLDEQAKLDTQNLYIQNQQSKVAERLKAAREKKVDPNQPFRGVDGGIAGVLAVLGTALGQYGTGITGAPNAGLQLFNNMIDRSVNEQLRLIEEEKEGALMAKAELDDFQFNNEAEKKAFIRSIVAEGKAAELASVQADKDLIAVHPMAAQMQAAIEEKLNEDLLRVNSTITRTANQRYQQATGPTLVPNPARAAEQQDAASRASIYENNRKAAGLDNSRSNIAAGELEIRDPTTGNVVGKAPTGERAQAANERMANLEAAEWTIDRMEELRKTEGFWQSEEAKAKYASYAADLKDSSWAATRSDAPSEIESEEHKAKFGGLELNRLRQGKQATQLQTFRQLLRQKAIPKLRQEGVSLEYLRQRMPDKDEGNAD